MKSKVITLSVPASILLFGEYFITHPQNQALCMAINHRAYLTTTVCEIASQSSTIGQSKPAVFNKHDTGNTSYCNNLKIESKFAHISHTWQKPLSCKMFAIAKKLYANYRQDYATATTLEIIPQTSVTINACIDTNSFFSPVSIQNTDKETKIKQDTTKIPTPHKLGIGSSEASAVLFCALVLILNNIDPLSCLATLALHASKTHFEWQEEKGSGYGAYTSVFGGMGLYTTNSPPTWQALPIPIDSYYYLFNNLHIISSKHAITKFQTWLAKQPNEALAMQHRVHTHFTNYPKNVTAQTIIEWLARAKHIGLALGKAIGVNAEISRNLAETLSLSVKTASHVWKSTGAGNENALGIFSHSINFLENKNAFLNTEYSLKSIKIDGGLRWE